MGQGVKADMNGKPIQRLLSAGVVGIGLALSTVPSLADDEGAGNAASPFGMEFELGAGGVVVPEFEGSDDYEISPFPVFRLKQLTVGSLSIGGKDNLGFSLRPSFRIIGKRKPSDVDGLPGMPRIGTAVELGLGAVYEQEYWRAFGNLRHGVTGHDGLVGELGADLKFSPNEQWSVSVGPRLSFADGSYMDKYFGVPAGIAGPVAYDTDGGLKSAGVEMLARYQFGPAWAVEGSLGWSRLLSDAADSPVTRAGDDDQFIGRISIMRRFSIGY
jgi:outer membrane protein